MSSIGKITGTVCRLTHNDGIKRLSLIYKSNQTLKIHNKSSIVCHQIALRGAFVEAPILWCVRSEEEAEGRAGIQTADCGQHADGRQTGNGRQTADGEKTGRRL